MDEQHLESTVECNATFCLPDCKDNLSFRQTTTLPISHGIIGGSRSRAKTAQIFRNVQSIEAQSRGINCFIDG